MELLKNFGFDPVLFSAQVINFLIILFVLKRFLYKPLLDMLKKRQKTIEEGLKQAEEARITLEKTEEKEREILKKARITADSMLEEAKKEAEVKAKKIEEEAKKEAESIIADAQRKIEISEKETEKKLATYVSKLAIDLITQSSKTLFSEKEQKEITENALKKIKI